MLSRHSRAYWLVGSDGSLYPHGDAANIPTHASSYPNPIIGITAAPNTTTFTYNGDGLRATETNQTNTTTYTYDTTTAVPQVLTDGTTDYIYGLNNEPIEQVDSGAGATSYLQHDQLGSTRLITDTTGAVTATYTYDTYGNTTGHTGTNSTPVQYAAGYHDTTTGLYYLTHRYYDPTTAQFLTIDPALTVTGQPYAYANDTPLNRIDSLGMWGWNPISDIGEALSDAAGYVEDHPIAVGLGLGVLSVATGGFGLAADLAFEGEAWMATAADATAIVSGAGAGALDQGACNSGDEAACVGAGLGFAGAAMGFPSFFGDIFGLESGSVGYALIKGSAALGFNLGLGALTIDATLAAFGKEQNNCAK